MEDSREQDIEGKLVKKVMQENGPSDTFGEFLFLVLNTNLLLLYIKVLNYEIHDRKGGYKENNTRDSTSIFFFFIRKFSY